MFVYSWYALIQTSLLHHLLSLFLSLSFLCHFIPSQIIVVFVHLQRLSLHLPLEGAPPVRLLLLVMESTCLLFFSIVAIFFVAAHGLSETESLLKFKNSLVIGRANALESWNRSNPPCKWTGVLCDRGFVWGLRLETFEISGSIDIEALMDLKSLRSLSFINNKLRGPFPEFKKLVALKSLYLSNNQFDVEIPKDAFDGMGWLKKLHLENNNFSGEIPTSLVKSPKLLELRLDGNRFTGQIPEFTHQPHMLNLSNNALSGQIPNILSTMDSKLFEGAPILFIFVISLNKPQYIIIF